nr:reverse transcriptase domain, reverse transcriptase zinc-binding domain protein [Tanacetum cinerariifolium]
AWSKVRVTCGMDAISPRFIHIIAFIVPISKGNMVISILSRIVVAATSYYIWREKNERLLKKKTSSLDQIAQVILSMVRLKLVTFKFKKMSIRSHLLLDQWMIPSYCIAYDGSFRVEYEWKPPHCIDCKSFDHDFKSCPERSKEVAPNTSVMDGKTNIVEENDDGFEEVNSRKKKKGAISRSFGGLRLNKPNSKV